MSDQDLTAPDPGGTSDEDFTTIMIVTVCVMLVLGLFLILCLVRFPSYDYIDNFMRDQKLFKHEWGSDVNLQRDEHGNLYKSRSSFLPPLASNTLDSTQFLELKSKDGKVRAVRLPKKSEVPDTHLPPMSRRGHRNNHTGGHHRDRDRGHHHYHNGGHRKRRSDSEGEDLERPPGRGNRSDRSRSDEDNYYISEPDSIDKAITNGSVGGRKDSRYSSNGYHRSSSRRSAGSRVRPATEPSRGKRGSNVRFRDRDEVILDVSNFDESYAYH